MVVEAELDNVVAGIRNKMVCMMVAITVLHVLVGVILVEVQDGRQGGDLMLLKDAQDIQVGNVVLEVVHVFQVCSESLVQPTSNSIHCRIHDDPVVHCRGTDHMAVYEVDADGDSSNVHVHHSHLSVEKVGMGDESEDDRQVDGVEDVQAEIHGDCGGEEEEVHACYCMVSDGMEEGASNTDCCPCNEVHSETWYNLVLSWVHR